MRLSGIEVAMTRTRAKMMMGLPPYVLLDVGISSAGMVDYFTDNGYGIRSP